MEVYLTGRSDDFTTACLGNPPGECHESIPPQTSCNHMAETDLDRAVVEDYDLHPTGPSGSAVVKKKKSKKVCRDGSGSSSDESDGPLHGDFSTLSSLEYPSDLPSGFSVEECFEDLVSDDEFFGQFDGRIICSRAMIPAEGKRSGCAGISASDLAAVAAIIANEVGGQT